MRDERKIGESANKSINEAQTGKISSCLNQPIVVRREYMQTIPRAGSARKAHQEQNQLVKRFFSLFLIGRCNEVFSLRNTARKLLDDRRELLLQLDQL